MAKKPAKIIASILVSTIIVSNSLFVYANDNVVAVHFLLCDTIEKESDTDLRDYVVRANFVRPQISLNDDKNKYKVVVSDKEKKNDDDDLDFTLNLLNMDLKQYKQELRNGEDLRSLLVKHEVAEQYDNKAFATYKATLAKAVENNAITELEMNELLVKYIENVYVVNNL